MAGNGEPTLKDVMELLNVMNNKMSNRDRHDSRGLSSSPVPKRLKPAPSDPGQRPPAPLTGSWASSDVIERVLYSRTDLDKRVGELAKEISADYASTATEDGFVVIGLMAGVYMFMADLTRNLTVPHEVEFMSVSSYGLGTVSSANVKIKKDLEKPIEGKDVLLVDEMCDTGRTMACLKNLLEDRGAKSVKVCVLLDKAERREAEIHLDYTGWICEDSFLVGYGMDWSHRFRSLPEVAVVRRSAYEKKPAH